MAVVSKKVAYLGKVYVHSERYFPLGAIILMLEKKSAELSWDPTWVFMTLLEIGIPFPVLHGIYDRLFKAKDPCWRTLNKPLHILQVIYHLLLKFVDTPSLSPPHERPSIAISLYDACATYLVELHSSVSRDPAVQATLTKFQGLQASLKRLLWKDDPDDVTHVSLKLYQICTNLISWTIFNRKTRQSFVVQYYCENRALDHLWTLPRKKKSSPNA